MSLFDTGLYEKARPGNSTAAYRAKEIHERLRLYTNHSEPVNARFGSMRVPAWHTLDDPRDNPLPETTSMEKLGIFGGTFDPPHIGHIAAAEAARVTLQLDRVLFVVANIPWQKVNGAVITDPDDRLALVRSAVADREGFEVSGLEIERGGHSFTAETLEELAEEARKLYLIIGSDLAPRLSTWKRPNVIQALATVAVVTRLGDKGKAVPPAGWDWVQVGCPGIEVSSREIRRWLQEGHPLGAVLTAPVVEEIRRRGLYRRGC